MKKIISLLVVLATVLSLLAGVCMAADKPAECDAASAGVVVSCSKDKGTKYCFETLTQAVINWACENLEGEKIITLQKDIDVSNPEETGYKNLYVPGALANWKSRPSNESGENALVIDLNGRTLSYAGESHLFYIERFGLTMENGSVVYKTTGSKRPVFNLGGSKKATAIGDGTEVWRPILTLQNVHVYYEADRDDTSGLVIRSYQFQPTINITDSVLWSKANTVIDIAKTTQADAKTPTTKAYTPVVNVKNSVIGAANGYAFYNVDEGATVNLENSVLVSNKNGRKDNTKSLINYVAKQECVENMDWSMNLLDGTEAYGYGFEYGKVVEKNVMAFEDVKESDWYYSFVKQLYEKGLVSGMTETTFVPNGKLTYGQALKLVTLAVGEKEPAKTNSHWASGYMQLAMDMGWLEDEVNPDAQISRLAFCRIAAAAKGISEQPASNPFKDTEDVSVLALVHAGIVSGMSADTFGPDVILTRAQIAKIICGLL